MICGAMKREPSPGFPDPASAWIAVAARDAAYDGRFVFAVKTTGIFCRPSCPARRPRTENVEFFADPARARLAGYRACLRCHPDRQVEKNDPIAAAHRLLSRDGDDRITLERLAGQVGLSPFHLQRRFKERYGLSPREFAAANRAARLRTALRAGVTVSRATYAAGYGSGSRVYESAAARLGMTPGRYARGGRGLEIRYTTVGSPFGRVLVAVTDRGISTVSLGRTDPELERALAAEFPAAVRTRVDAGADPWLAPLVNRVARTLARGDEPGPAIPLDLLGTAFQYRVWQALLAIPRGATRTYAEIARAIGRPRAVRAVARAIAANRVAVLVPCHRVIREDGSVGGYRWGIPTKRSLLAREGAGFSP
jgi:AraC family transcriptional regulator of adaptative response/methylated-DNA-[protein]-cysteine methyltransferase